MQQAPVHWRERAAPPAARWQPAQVQALFELPFVDLLFRAQSVHREHFDPADVQLSTDAVQALCFAAGADSIFHGDKLLTTGNSDVAADTALLARLGMTTS